MRARDEAIGRSVGDIEVDFDALHQLALNLRELVRELDQPNGTLLDEFADPDLAAAFWHAERDWRDQRRRLRTFLDGTASSVEVSLMQYRQLEGELSAATRPLSRR